jgi:DNA polymerase-1
MRTLLSPHCTKSSCHHYKTCLKSQCEVTSDGKQADVLFVSDYPDDGSDSPSRTPFMGRGGMLFRRLLSKVSFNRSYAVTSLCRFKANRAPTPAEIGNCLEFLHDDIRIVKPKVIVCLGSTALKVVMGKDDIKITKVRGRKFSQTIAGHSCILTATYHPTHVARNPGLLSVLRRDLATINTNDSSEFPIGSCELLKSVAEIRDYVEFLMHSLTKEHFVAFDYETIGLMRHHGNKPLTVQFSHDGKRGFVVPLCHRETPLGPDELAKVYKILRGLYRKPVSFYGFVGHNIKFEQMISIQCFGTPVVNKPFFCTQAGAFLLDENKLSLNKEFRDEGGIYSLDVVARELGFDGYKDSLKQDRAHLNDYSLKNVAEYGAMDAWVNWHVFQKQRLLARAERYEKQWMQMVEHWFSGAWRLMAQIEYNGFQIDMDQLRYLKSRESPIWGRIAQIKEEFNTLKTVKKANEIQFVKSSGGKAALFKKPWLFDIDKPQSKHTLFFDVLKLEPLSTGKSGEASIDKKFKEYHADVPEVAMLAELERTKKLFDSYVKPMNWRLDPRNLQEDSVDERIRGNYGLTNTLTGRANCYDPNMQNIPRAADATKKSVKDLFCAPPGKALVQVDHKTSEVKWLALISGDEGLIKNFKIARKYVDEFRENPTNSELLERTKAYDFHRLTASIMYGVAVEKVAKEQRQAAKMITFGLIYGKTSSTLALDLGITDDDAQALIEKFFMAYPKAKKWLGAIEEQAARQGYVSNPLGRRRRLYDAYLTGDNKLIHHANNQARNSPIQGVSSDVAIIGGVLFQDYLTENKIKDWPIVAFVHDSVVWEAPFDDVAESISIAERLMTEGARKYVERNFGYKMVLPIDLEFEIGRKLGSLTSWNYSPQHMNDIIANIRTT